MIVVIAPPSNYSNCRLKHDLQASTRGRQSRSSASRLRLSRNSSPLRPVNETAPSLQQKPLLPSAEGEMDDGERTDGETREV